MRLKHCRQNMRCYMYMSFENSVQFTLVYTKAVNSLGNYSPLFTIMVNQCRPNEVFSVINRCDATTKNNKKQQNEKVNLRPVVPVHYHAQCDKKQVIHNNI